MNGFSDAAHTSLFQLVIACHSGWSTSCFVSECRPGDLSRQFALAFHASISPRDLSWESPGPHGPQAGLDAPWASLAPLETGTSEKGRPDFSEVPPATSEKGRFLK